MSDMTLADYQAEVLLTLGNLSTSHPLIARGMHTRAINAAADDLIRWYPDRFPEHNDNSWTIGPTVAGENKVTLLDSTLGYSTILVIDKVHRPEDSAASTDPDGWEDTQEVPVSHSDVSTIGLMTKSASDTGYPSLYDRKGNYLIYHPTTRAGYESYLRVYGLAGEVHLVAAGDTFRMAANFDEALTLLAASKVAMYMPGRMQRSTELEAAARRKMTDGLSVTNRELDDLAVEGFGFGSGDNY